MNFLLLLTVLFNFTPIVLTSNPQKYTKLRILKGNVATIGRFPYHVSLQVRGRNVCGGSIVSNLHIVTAAHCFVNETGFVFNQSTKIVAGVAELKSVPLSRITVDAERFYIPMDFFKYDKTKHPIGDIAVVKLLEPLNVDKNPYLHKLNLPESFARSYDDETAIITGFGWNWVRLETDPKTHKTFEVGDSDDILRYAQVKIVNQTYCQKKYVHVISDKHICGQITESNDLNGVCSGDSGGPLVIEGDTLIGVVRSSPPMCDERTKPSLYTRVSSYLDFIVKAMRNVSDPNILSIKLPISRTFLKLHV